jgi:hypothetical protein
MRFRSLRQTGPWLDVLDLIAWRGFLAIFISKRIVRPKSIESQS